MADAKAVALIDGQRALVMEKSYSPAVLCPAAAAAEKLGVGREDAIFLGLEESGNPVFALPVGDEAGGGAQPFTVPCCPTQHQVAGGPPSIGTGA
jgi:hypothetical protein